MIRYVCTVYDLAARVYGQPIFAQSTAVAIRSFSDEVNRAAQDNPFFMHSSDFELRWIANFDEEEGTFENRGSDTLLVRGKDVRKENA